jgi:hypothetical protein
MLSSADGWAEIVMVRRLLPAVLCACLAGPALVLSAERPSSASVNQLVRDLGSPRYAVRQRARQALDHLGPAALPALRQASQDGDPEIRRQARALVAAITRKAEMDRLLAATPVRLVCRDMPVTAAVTELAKMSGYVIEIQGDKTQPAGRKITLDTGPTTFWQALDQLCRKAGLTERGLILAADKQVVHHEGVPANESNPNFRLVLVDRRPPELPTNYFKGIRVRALPATTPLSGLAKSDPNERFVVLEASLEPRFRLDKIIDLRLDRVTDQRDVRVRATPMFLPTGESDSPQTGYAYPVVVPYPFTLQNGMVEGNFRRCLVRARALRRFNVLQGTLIVEVHKRSEPVITVAHILKASGKSFSTPQGESLQVVSADRQTDGQVVLRLDTTSPLGNAIAGIQIANGVIRIRRGPNGPWERAGIDPANLHLLDAGGRKFQGAQVSAQGTSFAGRAITQQWSLTYRPEKGQGAPARLVYIGVLPVVVDVPFTLRNVPLP